MSKEKDSLKFKLHIAASLREVYEAFTSGTAFCEWLCDEAQVDARRGGHLYLWWQNGYFTNGDYLELAPEEKIVFSWHGAGEPAPTRVKVAFKEMETEVCLILTHQGLGIEKAWKKARKQFKQSWLRALQNLRSVLETGEDLRFVNRPRLGICALQALDAEQATQAGFPACPGLLIQGVENESPAAEAGLQTGDLLVRFAGARLESLADLGNALSQRQAGDKVKVMYYRGDQKLSAKACLSRHPLLEVPLQAKLLAETVSRHYDHFSVALAELLQTASEEAAEYRSDPQEWSIKDTLAHLIATERELQAWIARRTAGQEANFALQANQPVRIRAILSNFPRLTGLASELKRNQAETVAMAYDLSEGFVQQRRSYWRVGYILLQLSAQHLPDHLAQIRATLEKSGKVSGERPEHSQAGVEPDSPAQSPGPKWYEI